ncbi:MAG: bifunctional adenosylcobinamide kinase/adenosylcobinamide-phosphate guanylyltransferase [Firmicutes bacterium]|nr:bifunctional adenosylcobinamide kinase/adenosylcobinamide-phosphate guanylyltransferase [Bacillota bacterium]
MNVFISGGAKNGKSSFAQDIAVKMAKETGRPLYYVATMIPHDDEDRERIERHVRNRNGLGFRTIEAGKNLSAELHDPEGIYLIDSVTALLSNEMFREDGSMYRSAPRKITAELREMCHTFDSLIFVSDYMYSDAIDYSESVEAYKKGLAEIDKMLASECDLAIEMFFGFITEYSKDEEAPEELLEMAKRNDAAEAQQAAFDATEGLQRPAHPMAAEREMNFPWAEFNKPRNEEER